MPALSLQPLTLPRRSRTGWFPEPRGILAGPDHELEGLIIFLAGLDRDLDQRLALVRARRRAACEHKGVAEHNGVLARPEIEMPHPHLRIDAADEFDDLRAPTLGHLEIEGAGQMQRFHVIEPGETHMVVAQLPAMTMEISSWSSRSKAQACREAICSMTSTGCSGRPAMVVENVHIPRALFIQAGQGTESRSVARDRDGVCFTPLTGENLYASQARENETRRRVPQLCEPSEIRPRITLTRS